jgi:uncharacterized protein YndB with AHSA1/START domain
MARREIKVHRRIAAPAEAVWEVLTDVQHAPETLRGVTGVQILEQPAYGVGTRWVETRRILGKEDSQTLEVTESEPPRSTVVEARSAGVDYRTAFTLEPVEGGTRVEVVFGASHPDPNLLQRLTATVFGRVGAAVTARLLSQDLADIAARAEPGGADGSPAGGPAG